MNWAPAVVATQHTILHATLTQKHNLAFRNSVFGMENKYVCLDLFFDICLHNMPARHMERKSKQLHFHRL